MSEKDFYNQLTKIEKYLGDKIKKEKDEEVKSLYQFRKDCLLSVYHSAKDYYADIKRQSV